MRGHLLRALQWRAAIRQRSDVTSANGRRGAPRNLRDIIMKSRVVRPFVLSMFVVSLVSVSAAAQPAAPPNGSGKAPANGKSAPSPTTPTTQQPKPAAPKPGTQVPGTPSPQTANAATPVPGLVPPPGYVIGPEDVLSIVFWREKDMSSEVTVRPDGKISLPLLNDVDTAGLTPEELRVRLTEEAGKLIEEPTVTVVVKTINSRRVYVTGQVGKPGPYALAAPTTVLQMIATAGGVLEYAKSKEIRIMRSENGKQVSYKFNYKDVMQGKNLKQNIELRSGDTIIVP